MQSNQSGKRTAPDCSLVTRGMTSAGKTPGDVSGGLVDEHLPANVGDTASAGCRTEPVSHD